ncbi:hypothetical protein ROHU_026325 [Labeo rohita]|uniref:Uncharacterized protein n=1 Tax=Labeo rohita TaxID=84645 RepID=A0A498MBA1_LABRO|nr:hypothetical protein ROHU_026325 [Labeo rohita]
MTARSPHMITKITSTGHLLKRKAFFPETLRLVSFALSLSIEDVVLCQGHKASSTDPEDLSVSQGQAYVKLQANKENPARAIKTLTDSPLCTSESPDKGPSLASRTLIMDKWLPPCLYLALCRQCQMRCRSRRAKTLSQSGADKGRGTGGGAAVYRSDYTGAQSP